MLDHSETMWHRWILTDLLGSFMSPTLKSYCSDVWWWLPSWGTFSLYILLGSWGRSTFLAVWDLERFQFEIIQTPTRYCGVAHSSPLPHQVQFLLVFLTERKGTPGACSKLLQTAFISLPKGKCLLNFSTIL